MTDKQEQELDYKAICQQAYESGYTTGYMDGAIKAHEAKQEQGEPVAEYIGNNPDELDLSKRIGLIHRLKFIPLRSKLYTTPQQRTAAEGEDTRRAWVGLTDEEIDELHGSPMELEHSGALKWVRIIEAKLKEKNGG